MDSNGVQTIQTSASSDTSSSMIISQPYNFRMLPFSQYQDQKQKEFNKCIANIEKNVAVKSTFLALSQFKSKPKNLFSSSEDYLRLVQSIVEVLGFNNSAGAQQNSSSDQQVGDFFAAINHLVDSITDTVELPQIEQLFFIIFPYIRDNNVIDMSVLEENQHRQQQQQTYHRNLCLTLAIFLPKFTCQNLNQMILSRHLVQRLLLDKLDPGHCRWTQKFAMLTLECFLQCANLKQKLMQTMPNEMASLEAKLKLITLDYDNLQMNNLYSNNNNEQFYNSISNGFSARWLLNLMKSEGNDNERNKNITASIDELTTASTAENENVLDHQYANYHLKFHFDELCARSEYNWQSICFSFLHTSEVFFFEVVLLTDGPMRIGWSSEKKPSNLIVGDSLSSIGYDGHEKIIWIQKQKFELSKNFPRWKVGDVVSCLFIRSTTTFNFYLNGSKVMTKKKIKTKKTSLSLNYFPAASLFSQQQCVFNFGQNKTLFKYCSLNYNLIENLIQFSSNPTYIEIRPFLNHLSSFVNIKYLLEAHKQRFSTFKRSCSEEMLWETCLPKLLKVLSHYLDDQTNHQLFSLNSIKHSNVCTMLLYFIDMSQNSVRHLNFCEIKQMLAYALRLLKQKTTDDDLDVLALSLTIIEKLQIFDNIFSSHNVGTQVVEEFAMSELYNKTDAQLNFILTWMQDCVFLLKSQIKINTIVKVSSDGLTVRNDNHLDAPVTCCFPVNSGQIYYEVMIETEGLVQIGWSFKEDEFCIECDLKNDSNDDSQYFKFENDYNNVYSQWLPRKQISTCRYWNKNHVVGCLINFDKNEAAFYLNGDIISLIKFVIDKDKKLFAFAKLSPHTQCKFNFGKSPFYYDLNNKSYQTLHQVNTIQNNKLLSPFLINKNQKFIFLNFVHYSDVHQNVCDELIHAYFFNNNSYKLKILKKYLQKAVIFEDSVFRAMQSTINLFWKKTIVLNHYKIFYLLNYFTADFNLFSNWKTVFETKVLAFIKSLTYFNGETIKHRNGCIVLSNLIKCTPSNLMTIQIKTKMIKHFYKLLCCSKDLELHIWTVLAVESFFANQIVKISDFALIAEKIKTISQMPSLNMAILFHTSSNNNHHHRLIFNYIAHFVSTWFCKFVSLDKQMSSRLPLIKLSEDRFCARNDSKEVQYVRSIFPVTSGSYYYEATVLTSGPMHIGWGTRQSPFRATDFDHDKYFK